jgi:hypothetical protein
MNIEDEWRMFDPDDPRTYPVALNDVEIQFDNGWKLTGHFSGDLSIFSYCACEPVHENAKPTRWRYTNEFRAPLSESD